MEAIVTRSYISPSNLIMEALTNGTRSRPIDKEGSRKSVTGFRVKDAIFPTRLPENIYSSLSKRHIYDSVDYGVRDQLEPEL